MGRRNHMGKFSIVRGVEQRPHATILTGRSGIGKTHLASTIPGAFFICVEQGLKGASPDHVATLPRFERPKSLAEYLEMLAEVRAVARGDGIRHVVTDSLSGVERLINLKVCQLENVAHMEAKDFKKLWTAAMPIWQRVQNELDLLRDEAGVHVWLIAHGQETKTSTIDGDMFQTWDLALQGSGDSLGALRQLWRGWADHVLFIDWDADVTKGSIGKRSVGRFKSRILRTRETPSHYAKNRANLPPVLPATWPDLQRAMAAGVPANDARLRAQLAALLPQLGDADRAAVEADMALAKTPAALSSVLSRAQGMLSAARIDAEDDAPAASAEDVAAALAITGAALNDRADEVPAAAEPRREEPRMPPADTAAAAQAVADAAAAAALVDERIRVALQAAAAKADVDAIVEREILPLRLEKNSPRRTALLPLVKETSARVAGAAA
ncbi:MAG: AAA family ATPase [Polyangiaceae bacterium]